MRDNQLSISKWAATLAVAAGLVSYQAAAIEELVVYGTDASPAKPTISEELKRNMNAYLQALNAEQKAKISVELTSQRGAEIQIAVIKAPTRG